MIEKTNKPEKENIEKKQEESKVIKNDLEVTNQEPTGEEENITEKKTSEDSIVENVENSEKPEKVKISGKKAVKAKEKTEPETEEVTKEVSEESEKQKSVEKAEEKAEQKEVDSINKETEEVKKEVSEESEKQISVEKAEDKKPKTEEDNPEKNNDVKEEEKDNIDDEDGEDDNIEDNEDDNVNLEEKYNELSREQLVESLKEIVNETDINKIKTRVALIKVAFLKENSKIKDEQLEKFISEGNDETEFKYKDDELEKSFTQLFSIYKQNRQKFLKDQEKVKEDNLIAKKQVLEELKTLISSEETLKKTYDEFKVLQDKWREIGLIPKNEVNNLWQSYHFLVEKFFDKVKINKELRDLDMKKNLESKMVLCEKAEELLIETSIIKSFKELQRYHNQWKEIGPVPRESKDEIWDRFKSTTDKINERRRDHYAKIYENQESNLEAKTALCEKAEVIVVKEINTIKEWQTFTNEINDLFKIWKSIGTVPKKYNEEIWHRFRTYLNTFFENKKEYFQKLKDKQLNNYNLKVEICVQAEGMQDSTDWKETTRKLINLQKDWKKIGPAPRKYSEIIWKRFRAACDAFFNNKTSYFSNIHVHEDENIKLKYDLIEKVKKCEFGDDKKENLQKIKEFQREWTEIGHVPFKEKDKIWKEFRQAIDKQMVKLQISEVEISTMNFKTKMESMKDSPQAKNIIYKERIFLNNKISKLKDDIALWENNIGFLADSKNANVFKIEFEKKIDNAKKDLKIFEAKMKYLNSQM
ncbi:MAG: DUF349 domain-containing protein [Bacteroidales bacterium]|nr:DUF349 domain-containing protein [Bacteroidales bacterium]